MSLLLKEFDEQAQKAIVVAESISFDFGHQNVGSEHLLLSLLKMHDNQLKRLLKKYKVNEEVVEEDIKGCLEQAKINLFIWNIARVSKKS